MKWIAPTEKDSAANTLERQPWDAVDQFRDLEATITKNAVEILES